MNPEFREEVQRQERIRTRLARASFRLEMAELERIWAIIGFRCEVFVWHDCGRSKLGEAGSD